MNSIPPATIALGLALALAACAAGTGEGAGSQAPAAATAGAPEASAPRASAPPGDGTRIDAGAALGAPASAGASAPILTAPPSSSVTMLAPVATGLSAELALLGLDPQRLPPIEKLDPKALRGVMKLMARSLGVPCSGCHAEGDFAAPTRRKKIAAHMWNEFAAKLSLDGGAPLFCDSCHQGRTILLDRHDKKALGAWMNENFVTKLERKDSQSQECETCHVDMEMKFLSKWGAL